MAIRGARPSARYNVTLRYAEKRQGIYGPTTQRLEEALHAGLERDPHSTSLEGMEIEVAPRWNALDWLIAIWLVVLAAIGVIVVLYVVIEIVGLF